jgi:dephospho-CoA kinase
MLEHRAMTAEQAQERIGAQATPADRLAAADVVIDNSARLDATLARVDRLWENRLEPFARNLAAARDGRPAGPAVLVPADPSWPAEAARLAARIRAAAGQDLVAVDHIGSTSVPGLEAKDVLDLQLRVRGLAEADRMAPALAAAGFPRFPGVWQDTPTAADPDPAHWQKRLHGAADPGRAANIHVRADGSPAARYALAFRDWLRADPDARQAYQAEKRRLAALHASDGATAGYAAGKEPWFTAVAEPGLAAWLGTSGWRAPWESETAP